MKVTYFILPIAMVCSLAVWASVPGQTTLDLKEGGMEFVAIGRPAMIRIKGEGPKPEGNLSISDGNVSGKLLLALDKLKTGIDLRDTHMKDKYLETKKYPQAELTITKCQMPLENGVPVSKKMFPSREYCGFMEWNIQSADYSILN